MTVELIFIPEGRSEPDRVTLRAEPYESEDALVDRAVEAGYDLGEPLEVRRLQPASGPYGPSLWFNNRY